MRVTPPDLELWLTGHVRALAASENITALVTNKEPIDLQIPLQRPIIVIRDDSGPRTSHVSFDRSIGFSVIAGTRMNDKPANDLARWLSGILFDEEIYSYPNSPIAAVEWGGCNGPYAVYDDMDVARRYGTAQYVTVGSW
ncbi:hypothetical protein NCPPB3778_11 [Rathayibacter phage NCPPB3778]|nr:hypothetical protein NCPPB3778_11 [Rathayibacter phage NCPPB3778]